MKIRNIAFMMMGVLLVSGALLTSSYLRPKIYYARLPVSFSLAKTPIIEAKIGNIDSYLKLDLGSKVDLELDADLLSKLEKRPKNQTRWKDLKGNQYKTSSYTLPQIEIGGLEYHHVLAIEDSREFRKNILSWSGNQEQETPIIHRGVLGRPLLKDRVLFLDFPNQAMVICSKLDQLDREGISPSEWHKISLKLSPRFGIILSVETDLGSQRFILDTGCTLTLIRTPQVESLLLKEDVPGMKSFVSSKFTLNAEEFGPKKLYFFDITSEISEADGILGMDFLSRHRIVLDLPHQTAYIEPVSQ